MEQMPADFNGHDGGNKTIFFSKGTRRVENGVALCPEFADAHFFCLSSDDVFKKTKRRKNGLFVGLFVNYGDLFDDAFSMCVFLIKDVFHFFVKLFLQFSEQWLH